VFDGGARKNNVVQAEANVRAAEAQANAARDEIANQVWAAYSNLNTAFRQRQAATALLQAASQSYDSALESYNYGLRNFLDVTAAQRTLAQARSTDVLARTQVLTALADWHSEPAIRFNQQQRGRDHALQRNTSSGEVRVLSLALCVATRRLFTGSFRRCPGIVFPGLARLHGTGCSVYRTHAMGAAEVPHES
jgi:hypothetical protein